jgi:hypothetical protein
LTDKKLLDELLNEEYKTLFPYVSVTGAELAAVKISIRKWLEQKRGDLVRLAKISKQNPKDLGAVVIIDALLEEVKS